MILLLILSSLRKQSKRKRETGYHIRLERTIDVENTGKEEQKEEADTANSKPGKKGQQSQWEERDSYLETERKRKTETIHVQSEPRSCGWDATHLRPADSSKLPTQRGSKWVCVGIEKRKQKAERREKEWEEGKGRVTAAVTLWPAGSGINAENIQIKQKKNHTWFSFSVLQL